MCAMVILCLLQAYRRAREGSPQKIKICNLKTYRCYTATHHSCSQWKWKFNSCDRGLISCSLVHAVQNDLKQLKSLVCSALSRCISTLAVTKRY